jgi:hypothetical protein
VSSETISTAPKARMDIESLATKPARTKARACGIRSSER